MQTPVVTTGRLTIDRIEPQGSLGALVVAGDAGDAEAAGAGEVAGTGELEGAGDSCASAIAIVAPSAQIVPSAPASGL